MVSMKEFRKILIVFLCLAMNAGAQELLNYPLDTIHGEEVYRYEVERSIGLYRIGVNFNVSQNDIIRLNPQLRERGLHYGETLLIPTGRKVEKKPTVVKAEPAVVKEEPVIAPVVVVQDSAVVATDSIPSDTLAAKPDSVVIPDTRRVVELALMLPFESQQSKRSGNADRMMEFYQGALLALKDMQNDSTLYRLRVYDTERSERRVSALCDSAALDSVQAILGLVYPIQIERMSSWCAAHQVPLLLPFTDDAELETMPYVYQFNATDRQKAEQLCAWIKEREAHCVAIEVRDADLSPFVRTLRKEMRDKNIVCSGVGLRELMNDSATYALDRTKENIIILHSDKYQQVRMAIPHLEKLKNEGYRIRIICQYSWQKELGQLPRVFTSLFTVNPLRTKYENQWNTYFSDEHVSDAPRYDLLGYDLMHSLVNILHGKNELLGLQSHILWKQAGKGGWQNANVTVVER